MEYTPTCRFCFKSNADTKLVRISKDKALKEPLNVMFPPITEEERADWICLLCRRSFITYRQMLRRTARLRDKLSNTPFGGIDFSVEHRKNMVIVQTDFPLMGAEYGKRARRAEDELLEDGSSASDSENRVPPVASTSRQFTTATSSRRNGPGKNYPEVSSESDNGKEGKAKTLKKKRGKSPTRYCKVHGKPVQVANEPIPEPKHPCKHCSFVFSTLQQVDWHTRTHTSRGSIVCKHCSKVLPKVSSYLGHLEREHNELRRIRCGLCNELFAESANNGPVLHEQNHARSRMKYACSFCPSIFNSYQKLRSHRQKIHHDWKLRCRRPIRTTPKTESK